MIFGALLLAFIVYITLRGQLPAYAQLFVHNNTPPANAPAANGSQGNDGIGGDIAEVGQAIGTAATIAKFAAMFAA